MTTWLLQIGGAPVTEDQQFDAAPAELTWTINDSAPVVLAMTFTAGAAPWPFFDWIAPLGYIMDAEAGGPVVDLAWMLAPEIEGDEDADGFDLFWEITQDTEQTVFISAVETEDEQDEGALLLLFAIFEDMVIPPAPEGIHEVYLLSNVGRLLRKS